MKKNNEVIVVTINDIPTFKIVQYIKPITANVVLGINVFSEFLGELLT